MTDQPEPRSAEPITPRLRSLAWRRILRGLVLVGTLAWVVGSWGLHRYGLLKHLLPEKCLHPQPIFELCASGNRPQPPPINPFSLPPSPSAGCTNAGRGRGGRQRPLRRR